MNEQAPETPELKWRRATNAAGMDRAVEVARLPDGGAMLRDSNDPDGSQLRYTAAEWAAFNDGATRREFDDLRLAGNVTQAVAAVIGATTCGEPLAFQSSVGEGSEPTQTPNQSGPAGTSCAW